MDLKINTTYTNAQHCCTDRQVAHGGWLYLSRWLNSKMSPLLR